MKKYLFPIILSLCIGSLLSLFVISGYNDIEDISVSKSAKKVYYLQRGVYSSKESMKENMKDFQHYIYNVEDNQYHVYIAISRSKKNIEKIKGLYEKKSYNTYVETKVTDNEEFLKILVQYDEILSETENEDAIRTIVNQVLSKYEGMVNGEYKN